ncbi:hypothetical protein J437_LFUL016946 [Ladona fulva]|uniref:C-type lectin domain-containing protein n=1 Tax=Ladona fulva TaxID=123851 RepID=A0A8K0KLQ7_LADFU|nr:hypothetical protein J437_LFUL016946 [Ladona fulva]
MQQLTFCLLVTLSFAQLTTQLSIASWPSADNIELTITAHRNQLGHYVSKWALKDSSNALPENAKLDVKTSVSESQGRKTLIFQGAYTVPSSAPRGYEYFPGVGYYKFYPKGTKSYSKAMDTCINDGAHLAILNSEAEMKVLRSIFARHPDVFRYAYLGYHDQAEEGKFFTIFGDPLSKTGYERWDEGEPNQSYGNEDCGTMHRSGGLNDSPCERDFSMPFFCEYDPFLEQNKGNEIQ